jgi:hypothetical protein
MSVEDCCWFLEGRLTTIVGQLAPSDELGFVFQVSTAFTAIGLAIAFYRRRRNPELDTFTITASWTLLGTLAGVVVVAIEALLG